MVRMLKAVFGVWAIVAGIGYLFFAFTFLQDFVAGKTETYAALVWIIVGFPVLLLGWLIVRWGWQFVIGLR